MSGTAPASRAGGLGRRWAATRSGPTNQTKSRSPLQAAGEFPTTALWTTPSSSTQHPEHPVLHPDKQDLLPVPHLVLPQPTIPHPPWCLLPRPRAGQAQLQPPQSLQSLPRHPGKRNRPRFERSRRSRRSSARGSNVSGSSGSGCARERGNSNRWRRGERSKPGKPRR